MTIQYRNRHAFTLLEVTLASAVLIACAVVIAEMLHLVARQERTTDARHAALRAVANRLEVLRAHGWDELGERPLRDDPVPEEVRSLLKNAKLQSEIVAVEDGAARQIRVQLTWRDAAGNRVQPIELSAWKHRPARQEEQP